MTIEKGNRKVKLDETSALEKVREELNALQESELLRITTDVLAAVTTAFGVQPNIARMMPRIRKLPELRLDYIEKFPLYTDALYEAHAGYVSASRPAEPIPALAERATELRDQMYTDVQPLITRGLVNAEEVREVRTTIGYRALALDLTVLVDAVKPKWQALQGNTGIKLEEVQEAERLAKRLLQAVGEKELAPMAISEAAAVRARAFTLFMRSYGEIRRAISYLQFNDGDADAIVPSFFHSKGGPKKKNDQDSPSTDPNDPPKDDPAVVPPVVATPAPGSSDKAGTPNSDPFGRETA